METRHRHRKVGARLGALTAASLIALGILPGPVAAIAPTSGGAVDATIFEVNVSSTVDANDPHVSGRFASYTAGLSTIRFYDFVTGADSQVPSAEGATDLLSDVSAGHIVFSRIDSAGSRVMVFDISDNSGTEVDSQPTPVTRIGAAIGSTTIAFIDLTSVSTGNLHASFIGGASAQVTDDGRYTRKPSVAPQGGLIVYESCATDPADCSVRQAAWNGTTWQVTNVTEDGVEAEANPDTDGTIVVFDADRGGDREIAWTPVGGGTEQLITMSGLQRNPSLSSGIVAFESVAVGGSAADVLLYEVASNRLFQVTDTVGVDEVLNDVFVLPDGTVRVVWAKGPDGDRDVYGADLVLPPVGPTYTFGGLQAPVDPLPTFNSMKAGAAVPVKFSLGGDFGLDIFAAGSPKSQTVGCDSTAPVDGIEQTMSAGGSGLSYDATYDLYTYVWKTDKAWSGTCRQLVLAFGEGTGARANFKFR